MIYSDLTAHDIIKDPIWHEIPLTNWEWQIINTRAFSRLRFIKQMGFVFLAFPGANHTRYEHSIGALQAATLLFQMLGKTHEDMIDPTSGMKALRLSILLHDIGHPPFSHAVEETFHKYPSLLEFGNSKEKHVKEIKSILGNPPEYSHEQFSSHVVGANDEISEIVRSTGCDINQIKKLAIGKLDEHGLSHLNAFIDGDFDADKIDYIIRDSYYCGLSYKIDLNEFRGKLNFEKLGNDRAHKLFLSPEGISAISSLLLSRYKLTKEVHNNELNRIATQMLIEKIKIWLDSQSFNERAKNIIDLHTIFTDHQFIALLAQHHGGPDINDILNGNLYKSVFSFPFSKMHPTVKLSTHFMIDNPTYLAKLQDVLRKDFSNDNLIVDIREAKPPKFRTLISFEQIKDGQAIMTPRNIFDRYYMPHGILIDSFNDLSVYIYDRYNNPLCIAKEKLDTLNEDTRNMPDIYFQYLSELQSIVSKRMLQSAREVRQKKFQDNIIFDLDFLMIILAAIEDFGREDLQHRELWIYSDSALQSYLRRVVTHFEKKGLQIASKYIWDNSNFSTKIFRDFERLICMGLVDHVHKPVPHPDSWGSRIDRRISGWGKGYVKIEIADQHYDVYKYVTESLKKIKKDLKDIVNLEKDCEKIDDFQKITEREPLNEEINVIRKRLKKTSDIILCI